MVTTSTSNGERKRYHHGDLRATLVETGLKCLECCDRADISLRQIARDAGVSATAVYRHFPDKNALMAAMAEIGVEKLGKYQWEATREAGSIAAALNESGRAYVRFALAHPALFRLISAHPHPDGIAIFGESLAARMLQGYAKTFRSDEREAQRLMIQVWSVVHGMAMLMLDGMLPQDEALIDGVIDMESMFQLEEGSSNDASP